MYSHIFVYTPALDGALNSQFEQALSVPHVTYHVSVTIFFIKEKYFNTGRSSVVLKMHSDIEDIPEIFFLLYFVPLTSFNHFLYNTSPVLLFSHFYYCTHLLSLTVSCLPPHMPAFCRWCVYAKTPNWP